MSKKVSKFGINYKDLDKTIIKIFNKKTPSARLQIEKLLKRVIDDVAEGRNPEY